MLGKHCSVLPKRESICACVDCFQPNTEDRIGVTVLKCTINSTECVDEKKNQIVFSEKVATGATFILLIGCYETFEKD